MTSKFPQRKIGDDFVSALGLGCMGMSIGATNDEEALEVLTLAADLGINFWVTSDSYGPFINESLLGKWFRQTGRRSEIFLATKFGIKVKDGKMEVDGSKDYVKEACKGSLERLGTDYIDLYYLQRVDSKIPIEETVDAMTQLKKEGKIRYLGLSECSARTLRRASKIHPIAAAEMEYSPFALEIESSQTEFLTTARELGVKIVAYSPLGRGFLTGAIRKREDVDVRRRVFPRFDEKNFEGNLRLVDMFGEVAKAKGCTSGQLALAWVLAQGDDIIPIPGTKHVKYLKENVGAVNVKVSKEDDEKIREIIDSLGGSKGARYPEPFLSQCFGDSPEVGSA